MRFGLLCRFGPALLPLLSVLSTPVPGRAEADPALVEAGRRATAFVIAQTEDGGGGTGTAFCIDTAGIFVTNDHVAVPGGKPAKITLVVAPGTKAERKLAA